MKIAYFDFRYPKGHKEQNCYYINILHSLGHEVTVFCPVDWYSDFPISESVQIIDMPFDVVTNSYTGIRNIIELVKREIQALKIASKKSFDRYYIASFEGISYCIFDLLTPRTLKYLVYHDNIDALDNWIRRFCFNLYRENNTHVVFQPYMRDRLLELCNYKKNFDIKILHHQLNIKSISGNLLLDFPEIIALSNTNSEDIINDLIELDQIGYFNSNNVKFVLKSKVKSYKGNKINVINEYLDKEIYDRYFCNCKVVYMPFSPSNRYRESGTIIDALSNGKSVIATDIMIAQAYKKNYPENVFIYHNYEELRDLIDIALFKNNVNPTFIMRHSQRSILEDMRNILDE